MSLCISSVTVLMLGTAHAIEIGGVKFDDHVRLGNSEIVANGAGLRKKAFFKAYAMALYITEKQSDAQRILATKGAKRISISLLRDLSAKQFIDALQEGIEENHSESELAALKDRVRQLAETMQAVGEAKSGTLVFLDWLPEGGTRLSINGQPKGKDIDGEDFYRALLRIWLGDRPVADDLKQALLGKVS